MPQNLGLQEKDVINFCNRNNLDYEPKQKLYAKWGDTIKFTCKGCNKFTFSIKALAHWCKGGENKGIDANVTCPICEINYTGPLPTDDIVTKLPEDLLRNLIKQDKWSLIKYTNTKQLATYQCRDCGCTKEILPMNLFHGRHNGCLNCYKKKI